MSSYHDMSSAKDYRVRRGAISAYGRALASSKQLRWLILTVGAGLLILSALIWNTASATLSLVFLCVLVIAIVVGLWVIYRHVKSHFIEPDLAFRIWLQQVCDGELDATIGLDKEHRHYKELNFHTRNLTTSLRRLSDDMDSLVESQTQRVNDQKRVLELLFKLTTDVSGETEDEMAFATVCDHLAEWFEHATVSCYLSDAVGTVPITTATNVDQTALRCVAIRQAHSGAGEIGASVTEVDGSAADFGASVVDIRHGKSLTIEQIPRQITTAEPADRADINQRWVPFFAGDEPAGVLIVDIETAKHKQRIETRRVLTTVSEQLSLFCSKKLVQEQILESRLSRDRNELAAEIHDSLAQTLLAVRYQATLLSEKIETQSDRQLKQDILKIRGTIEEANEEIRGLIREYRYPLSEHRYADSLQLEIELFNQSTSTPVFFQSDDPQIRFTPREESVVRRIVGESLNNAKKYANASMVRVLLQRTSSGMRRILIEDDGIGFDNLEPSTTPASNDTGKQIGLTIMRERALSIGANLIIDSEPGEGTRIAITMPPMIESRGVAV